MVDPRPAPPRAGQPRRATISRSLGCCARRRRTRRSATCMACAGPLYERLWRPLAARRAQHRAARGSRGARRRGDRARRWRPGGRSLPAARSRATACRPRFVDPALRTCSRRRAAESGSAGGCARSSFDGERVARLDFGDGRPSALGDGDARRPRGAGPGRGRAACRASRRRPSFAPSSTRISASTPPRRHPAHARRRQRPGEWLFAFPDRLSVTISGADRLLDAPREELAAGDLARGGRRSTGLAAALPPWQIVKERRATFAATPARGGAAPGRAHAIGAISCWPATGPRPACRPRSKARSVRAIAAADLVQRRR